LECAGRIGSPFEVATTYQNPPAAGKAYGLQRSEMIYLRNNVRVSAEIRLIGAPWDSCMLERIDLQPLFFAPFVSSMMRVDTGWIDYNGHMNMAYYNVLFDRCVDEAYELIGAGQDYVARYRHSYYTAEVHVRYLRELHAGDPVRVTFQLLDYDIRRLYYFEQLYHGHEGWLSATSENMALHVDMDNKRTAPIPPAVADRLAAMKAVHAYLPRPAGVGRGISMRKG
jgi:acyl-CoA thioester hydrolase